LRMCPTLFMRTLAIQRVALDAIFLTGQGVLDGIAFGHVLYV